MPHADPLAEWLPPVQLEPPRPPRAPVSWGRGGWDQVLGEPKGPLLHPPCRRSLWPSVPFHHCSGLLTPRSVAGVTGSQGIRESPPSPRDTRQQLQLCTSGRRETSGPLIILLLQSASLSPERLQAAKCQPCMRGPQSPSTGVSSPWCGSWSWEWPLKTPRRFKMSLSCWGPSDSTAGTCLPHGHLGWIPTIPQGPLSAAECDPKAQTKLEMEAGESCGEDAGLAHSRPGCDPRAQSQEFYVPDVSLKENKALPVLGGGGATVTAAMTWLTPQGMPLPCTPASLLSQVCQARSPKSSKEACSAQQCSKPLSQRRSPRPVQRGSSGGV